MNPQPYEPEPTAAEVAAVEAAEAEARWKRRVSALLQSAETREDEQNPGAYW